MRTQTTRLSAVSDAIATATLDSAIATKGDHRCNFAIISPLSYLHRPI